MRRVGKLTSRASGCASADIRLSWTAEPRQRHGCSCRGSCRFFQVSVNEGDGHRTFTRSGGDAFDRTMAHIPGGEGTWDGGLQVVRRTLQRPGGWGLAVDQEVGTGDEITALIADDGGVSSPVGVGDAADGDEQPWRSCPTSFLRRARADSNELKGDLSLQAGNLHVVLHLHVGGAEDPL